MNIKSIILIVAMLSFSSIHAQEIPIEYLNMNLEKDKQEFSKPVLINEIAGISVEHIALTNGVRRDDLMLDGFKFIYLFIKGQGQVNDGKEVYDIVPETILIPGLVPSISIESAKNDTLHLLKISSKLTKQDMLDLKEFPKENTEQTYFKRFIDTEAYTEAIKSPNTVSRTVLPNKYIPRIAMGTVETIGPDKVDPHEHGMLEQLFLGLTDNQVVVFADEAQIDFPAYSVLHIPLGSSHSVKVVEGKKMYYMWMDFFLDKKGEEWLKTHKSVEK